MRKQRMPVATSITFFGGFRGSRKLKPSLSLIASWEGMILTHFFSKTSPVLRPKTTRRGSDVWENTSTIARRGFSHQARWNASTGIDSQCDHLHLGFLFQKDGEKEPKWFFWDKTGLGMTTYVFQTCQVVLFSKLLKQPLIKQNVLST